MVGDEQTAFDVRLERDLSVLRTLAFLGCASFAHLHLLCFPDSVASTARVGLSNLQDAGYLIHSRWLLKHANRPTGRVWTITSRGLELLRQYVASLDTTPKIDLGRPSMAMEYEAWQRRMDVRTLIVSLILEARRSAFLAGLTATPASIWPTVFDTPQSEPDILLSIGWQKPKPKDSNWLPWATTVPFHQGVHYAVYLDRGVAPSALPWLVDASRNMTLEARVPVLVLNSEGHYRVIRHELENIGWQKSVRLSTWDQLRTGVGFGCWRDGHGRVCALSLD